MTENTAHVAQVLPDVQPHGLHRWFAPSFPSHSSRNLSVSMLRVFLLPVLTNTVRIKPLASFWHSSTIHFGPFASVLQRAKRRLPLCMKSFCQPAYDESEGLPGAPLPIVSKTLA